jgi:C4-dicarboxylate-specific signal transduction histidine kinase
VSSVKVADAVAEALVVLASRLARTPCKVEQVGCAVDVKAVESQLVCVISNVLNNSLDAMEPQETRGVRIDVSSTGTTDSTVAIHIADCGPGLPPAFIDRLFQPFVSTKPPGKGLGLGLALSREVVRQMGGDLIAANRPEGGAVVTITLPGARC